MHVENVPLAEQEFVGSHFRDSDDQLVTRRASSRAVPHESVIDLLDRHAA